MIEIIYQNKNLVVVLKESGWLSVPSRMGKSDSRPVLGMHLQDQLNHQQGESLLTIFPVHRLDFEVSGLLIFALNSDSQRVLNSAFEYKRIQKVYQALTELPQEAEALPPLHQWQNWESILVKGKKRAFEAPYGKKSITKAQLVAVERESARWHLQPVTGRSHQLRYEMAKHGVPIIGDRLYGGPALSEPNRIFLHAFQLSHEDSDLDALGLPRLLEHNSDFKV